MAKRFWDASNRPPRGGWNYPIAGALVSRYSESEILGALKQWKVNNGTFTTDEALSEELWAYYNNREPERVGPGFVPSPVLPDVAGGQLIIADKTPERQGPPIWLFLNTLAAQWSPGLHDYFLATCDAIVSILDCPDCRNEWRRLLQTYPPVSLASRLAVCQWVNDRHNDVNARKGKTLFPYSRMVTEFGAPLQ